jgi:hypothetical protein
MSYRLKEFMEGTRPDPWRDAVPFSSTVSASNAELFDAAAKHDVASLRQTISRWLGQNQPCLFGKAAARKDLLSFCFITEDDVRKGDPHVKDLIQDARLSWRKEAFGGRHSGFLIVVISERLAHAVPDDSVMEFARKLTSLYLDGRDIRTDEIYHDHLFLEIPTNRQMFQWSVGANYFSAHGDGRWWHDHRIPGGIALSMNSVGHMIKSAIMLSGIHKFEATMGIDSDSLDNVNVDSPERALMMAMQTILNASESAPSGRATFLLDRDNEHHGCPVSLPPKLSKYQCREYAGYYHTDITLPSEYFSPAIERPQDQQLIRLNFSYLTDDSFENPDHVTMGTGRRIRSDDSEKVLRLVPKLVRADESAALGELLHFLGRELK